MTAWKNLHFRPPILRPEDGRCSHLVLIRWPKNLERTPMVGRFVMTPKEPSNYFFVSGSLSLLELNNFDLEWTEVLE